MTVHINFNAKAVFGPKLEYGDLFTAIPFRKLLLHSKERYFCSTYSRHLFLYLY